MRRMLTLAGAVKEANAAFYRRLGTRTRLHAWSSRLTLDLPHTGARALRPRRGRPHSLRVHR